MNNDLQNSVNSQIPPSVTGGNNSGLQQKSVDPFMFQKALRTYELDMAESLKRKKTSVASIAIAETVKKQEEKRMENPGTARTGTQSGFVGPTNDNAVSATPQTTRSTNIIGTLAKVILLFVLLGGGGYVLYVYGSKFLESNQIVLPTQTTTFKFASILPNAEQRSFATETISTGQLRPTLVSNIQNAPQTTKIVEIIPTRGKNETLVRIPIKELLVSLELQIPENIVRNLLPQYFIGYTTINQKNSPIIILKNSFFQNAYAGMLAWERTMYRDIGPLFEGATPVQIPRNTNLAPIASSTNSVATSSNRATSTNSATSTRNTAATTTKQATSTVATTVVAPVIPLQNANPVLFRALPTFSDKVYKNLDIRVLSRAGENSILIYTFIDNDTIIITKDENTLQRVLETLDNTVYTR